MRAEWARLVHAGEAMSRLERARAVGGLVVGIALAALAGWWMGVKPSEAVRYAAGVSPKVIVACAFSSFVVLGLQALRWFLVMRPVLALRYGEAYRAQIIGMMFNAVLPARGGDLLRVQYLARRIGKSRATILGTEVVDRWLDWWGWFPMLFGVALIGGVPSWLYEALGFIGLLLVSWGATMVVLSRRGYRPKPGGRWSRIYLSFVDGVRQFGSTRTLLLALVIAPLPWLWESLAVSAAARAFGIQLSLVKAFSVLVGFNVAMVVPSPGAVGTADTGGTAALVALGVDQSKAIAFIFVYHLTQLLPGIVAGVAILVAENEKLFGRVTSLPETTGAASVRGSDVAQRDPTQ